MSDAAALLALAQRYWAESAFDESLAAFTQLCEIAPDHPEAGAGRLAAARGLAGVGHHWLRNGDPQRAYEALRQADAVLADTPELLADLAAASVAVRQFDCAADAYARLAALDPTQPDVWRGLALFLTEVNRPEQAVAAWRALLALTPGDAAAHTNLIFCLNFCDGDDAEQQAERRAFACDQRAALADVPRPADPRQPTPRPAPRGPQARRLKLGYVTRYFRRQAATFAFAPAIIHHDPAAFEITAYSSLDRADDVTDALRPHVDHWIDVHDLDDAALADRIRADEIDILVDCCGHMAGGRLGAFARRPAPVQITAWGEPTGTGLAEIDHLLADRVIVPDAVRPLLAERTLDLSCYIGFWQPEPLPPPTWAAAPDAPFCFGSFNRALKLTDATLALWARILAAAPGATILLKDASFLHVDQRQRVYAAFAAAGVGPERAILLDMTHRHEHFDLYRRVDLALDPMPHGAGMTTLDALWMGVPTLTCPGRIISSRLAASCMTAADLPQFITADPDDYVARAVAYAAKPTTLRAGRADLRARMAARPIGDPVAYAREVEAAYRRAWDLAWSARPIPTPTPTLGSGA